MNYQILGSNWFGDMGQSLSNDVMSQYADLVMQQSQALWEREDSAYQRMVEDMKKAGLNPWTGINSGGLSAGNNIPAMDSLNSVLGMITSNLSAEDLGRKYVNQAQNFVGQLLDMYTSSMRSLGSVLGSL